MGQHQSLVDFQRSSRNAPAHLVDTGHIPADQVDTTMKSLWHTVKLEELPDEHHNYFKSLGYFQDSFDHLQPEESYPHYEFSQYETPYFDSSYNK
jgi:hypothetical protein